MRFFASISTAVLLLAATAVPHAAAADDDGRIAALIIDGQNNHAMWPKTTMMMKHYLEESGRFRVDVARTRYTWNGGDLLDQYPLDDGREYENLKEPKPDPDFKPAFSEYDVVISNFGWKAAEWPAETKRALDQYVRGGGGFVVIHAANNSFGDWDEFNRMIGLGGWDGRDERSGPYLYVEQPGEPVRRDPTPGKAGSHGPQHEFQIVIREPEHPITRGLPRAWLHTQDELYQQLRGPAESVTVLATAYADPMFRGTGRHEPMLMTIDYGDGRVFHTPMGHGDRSMECVGFITVLARGTEWAATGEVTLHDIPDDFPTPNRSSRRPFTR